MRDRVLYKLSLGYDKQARLMLYTRLDRVSWCGGSHGTASHAGFKDAVHVAMGGLGVVGGWFGAPRI